MLFAEPNPTISQIDLIVTVVSNSTEAETHAARANHGLVCYLRGEYEYRHQGSTVVTREGDLLYLPKGQPYRVRPLTRGSCIAVNFQMARWNAHPPIAFRPEEFERYRDLFSQADRSWVLKQPGYYALCLAHLNRLVSMLQRHQAMPAPASGAVYRRIYPAIQYLEEHYSDPELTIRELAARSGLSEAYFRRLFSQVYGMAPLKYVHQIRMNRAADLLRAETMSVAEIGRAVGYDNPFHFSNAFKQHTGMRPSEYRG